MAWRLYEGDNRDVVPTFAADSIDAVATDPPYGILGADWDVWPDPQVWHELGIVVKPDGLMALTIAPHVAHERIPDVVAAGWHVLEVGFWVYGSGRPVSQGRLKRCYDLVYFFGREQNKLNVEEARGAFQSGAATGNTGCVSRCAGRLGRQFGQSGERNYTYGQDYYPANVACEVDCGAFGLSGYGLIFAVKRTRPIGRRTEETHPTEKPLDLFAQIVRLVSKPGDTVLDPWMGRATTGKACVALGRSFAGIDIKPEYVAMARRRLETVQMMLG